MKTPAFTRREFVRLGAGAAVAGAAAKATMLQPPALEAQTVRSGRKIRFAAIGTGIRGCDLLRSARKVPTGELVATADLYDMRWKAGLEAYGVDVPTTEDYRPLLDRKDVDAVIVAVSGHLHRTIVVDCLASSRPWTRACRWWKTKSSEIMRPSPATWPTTLTSIAARHPGTLTPRPSKAETRFSRRNCT